MKRYRIGAIDTKMILLLAAAGAAIYLFMRKKKGGTVTVPEPEKISEEQYTQPTAATEGEHAAPSMAHELATLPSRTPLTATAKIYKPGKIHYARPAARPVKKKTTVKKRVGFPDVY